jgi:predicted RNA-binding Zn-ribbon protein involved in translation (DUF1610 family)
MEETSEFTDARMCPVCETAIPILKMELRFVGRYSCPNCGNDVLIEGDKPQG